jgi:hypothetical protein
MQNVQKLKEGENIPPFLRRGKSRVEITTPENPGQSDHVGGSPMATDDSDVPFENDVPSANVLRV